MEIVAETLSETVTPTATTRSPEDQDLLERSTKKSKRGRELEERVGFKPDDELVHETPLSAGLKTPKSAQWRTPAATPSHAWQQERPQEPPVEEIVLDEEAMNEDDMDPLCPVVPVTREEKERLRRPWRRSLIIKVLGRMVNYSYLRQRLLKMWKLEATFELITLDSKFFLAKFETLRDYDFAKFEGPWMILDHYLVVQEWKPNFDPRDATTNKLLAWVRFPALPVEYSDDDFLVTIRRNVGRPIRVDNTTSLASKGSFARICVEIDISKPLISKFTLEQKSWPIVYERLHLVCFSCGVYGHRAEQCGKGEPEMTDGPVEGINQGENRGTRSETRNAVASKSQFAAHHLKVTLELGCWFPEKKEEEETEGVSVQLLATNRLERIHAHQDSHKEGSKRIRVMQHLKG